MDYQNTMLVMEEPRGPSQLIEIAVPAQVVSVVQLVFVHVRRILSLQTLHTVVESMVFNHKCITPMCLFFFRQIIR